MHCCTEQTVVIGTLQTETSTNKVCFSSLRLHLFDCGTEKISFSLQIFTSNIFGVKYCRTVMRSLHFFHLLGAEQSPTAV